MKERYYSTSAVRIRYGKGDYSIMGNGCIKCVVVDDQQNNESYISIVPGDDDSEMELNGRHWNSTCHLSLASRKPKIVSDEEKNRILNTFRGLITGYPVSELCVRFSERDSLICDAIEVKGGQENRSPYIGYSKFAIRFIVFTSDGRPQILKKLSLPDAIKSFDVSLKEKPGQVLCQQRFGVSLLNGEELEDFINGCKTSYMGRPAYAWQEVTGNVQSDSTVRSIKLYVNTKEMFAHFIFAETLWERTYEVISHASMDPWNEECRESRMNYLWAMFAFDDHYLLNLILKLSQIAKLEPFAVDGGNPDVLSTNITFPEDFCKSDFEKSLDIHLFQTIKTEEERG